jgi:ZIP family zinc transporter
LDLIVHVLSGGHRHHHHDGDCETEKRNDEEMVPQIVLCCDVNDPAGELEEWRHRIEMEEKQEESNEQRSSTRQQHDLNVASNAEAPPSCRSTTGDVEAPPVASSTGDETTKHDETATHRTENRRLIKMGLKTALAIAIHNFPEGLATFVSALDEPQVGALLAIAVGIHNIPEGLCVALPIYYATGSRWKAFSWALLSGISEPIGALFGWVILASVFTDNVYAILFGIVGGMMVIIAIKELFPTAHRYDPQDTVVTYSFIAGMFIMGLSLVLFRL